MWQSSSAPEIRQHWPSVRHNGLDDSPQLQIDIDQRKAQALGVSIDDINDTLQTAWGSSYVNDFMDRGRVKKVYVQAAAKYRMLPDDINLWYVRNNNGGMVPFSAFATSPEASCKRPNSANTSSKLVTIFIRFNMFSLSARQISEFSAWKGKTL